MFRRPLADEVAIDFPSTRAALDCLRRDQVDVDGAHLVSAEIALSPDQAAAGATVDLAITLRHTCSACGGRGERWGDHCAACAGTGHAARGESLAVHVPRGVSDGDRFSFFITPIGGPRTRIDVRVAVG
jgi:hypothetical protein